MQIVQVQFMHSTYVIRVGGGDRQQENQNVPTNGFSFQRDAMDNKKCKLVSSFAFAPL